ncbi:MAG: hypothetical protein AAB857_03045 [Patescibacteria group bacterium]
MISKIKTYLIHTPYRFFGFVALNTGSTGNGYQGVDITIQNVFGIITGLACWFTRFALILIVVYIIIYGIKFMMAQGNPTKYEEAKKSFTWGLVGVLVILGTYTIIATIANGLGADYSLIVPLDCSY